MAWGSVKMQPSCESLSLAALAAMAAADRSLCHSPSVHEPGREQLPVPRRPRLRNLLALLRSGLTLWRKRGASGGRVSGWVLRGPNGCGR